MSDKILPKVPQKVDLVAIYILMLGALLLSPALFGAWAGKWSTLLSEIVLLGIALLYLSSCSLLTAVNLRLSGISPQSTRNVLLVAIPVAFLLDELDRLVGVIFPIPNMRYERLIDQVTISNFQEGMAVFLAVVIVAPVVEEIIFRGLFQKALEKKYRLVKAILITSFLFGFVHFQPWWLIQLVVLSVLVGYLVSRSESILPAVIIHSISNLLNLVIYNSSDSGWLDWYLWNSHVNPLILILSTVLILLLWNRLIKSLSDNQFERNTS